MFLLLVNKQFLCLRRFLIGQVLITDQISFLIINFNGKKRRIMFNLKRGVVWLAVLNAKTNEENWKEKKVKRN